MQKQQRSTEALFWNSKLDDFLSFSSKADSWECTLNMCSRVIQCSENSWKYWSCVESVRVVMKNCHSRHPPLNHCQKNSDVWKFCWWLRKRCFQEQWKRGNSHSRNVLFTDGRMVNRNYRRRVDDCKIVEKSTYPPYSFTQMRSRMVQLSETLGERRSIFKFEIILKIKSLWFSRHTQTRK